jgi:hypothetical protein
MVCQGEFFVKVPTDVKKIMSIFLTFLFVCLILKIPIQTSIYGSRFLPRALVQSLPGSPLYLLRHLQKFWCTHSALWLVPSPQILGSKRDIKNLHFHTLREVLDIDSLRCASTIIFRSFALLQLLYGWQHQSQKLHIVVYIWEFCLWDTPKKTLYSL